MTDNKNSNHKVMHVARSSTIRETLNPQILPKKVPGSVHSVKAEDLLKMLERTNKND